MDRQINQRYRDLSQYKTRREPLLNTDALQSWVFPHISVKMGITESPACIYEDEARRKPCLFQVPTMNKTAENIRKKVWRTQKGEI